MWHLVNEQKSITDSLVTYVSEAESEHSTCYSKQQTLSGLAGRDTHVKKNNTSHTPCEE